MTSVPWAITNTVRITWEDIAEQSGLLAGAHPYPDKYWGNTSIKREPWAWSVLLEVTKVSLENRFSCMNKPFQEWQELCTEFISQDAVTLPVPQPEPVPELEQLHGLFPFHRPCCCRGGKTHCPWVMASKITTKPMVIWDLWGIFTVRLIWNWLV